MVLWLEGALALVELLALLVLWKGLRSTRVHATRHRLDDLEERSDYLQHQIRRLRGHVTGGIRYDDDDEPGEPPDIAPSVPNDFPEDEYQRLLTERKHGTGI